MNATSPSQSFYFTDSAGKPFRARLITCASPISFHTQLAAHISGAIVAPVTGLKGLEKSIAAHKAEQKTGTAPRTLSAGNQTPISQLHGLAKAIAAHQAETKRP